MSRNIDELIETPISEVMKWDNNDWKVNIWQVVAENVRGSTYLKKKVDSHESRIKSLEGTETSDRKYAKYSPWVILIAGISLAAMNYIGGTVV